MPLNSRELITAIKETVTEYETGTRGVFARLGFGSSPGIGHSGAPTKIAGVNHMLSSIERETNEEKKLAMLMALIAAINEKGGSLSATLAEKLITGKYEESPSSQVQTLGQFDNKNTLAGLIGTEIKNNDRQIKKELVSGASDASYITGYKIDKETTVKAFVDDYGSKLTGELKIVFESRQAVSALEGKALGDVQMTTQRNFRPE